MTDNGITPFRQAARALPHATEDELTQWAEAEVAAEVLLGAGSAEPGPPPLSEKAREQLRQTDERLADEASRLGLQLIEADPKDRARRRQLLWTSGVILAAGVLGLLGEVALNRPGAARLLGVDILAASQLDHVLALGAALGLTLVCVLPGWLAVRYGHRLLEGKDVQVNRDVSGALLFGSILAVVAIALAWLRAQTSGVEVGSVDGLLAAAMSDGLLFAQLLFSFGVPLGVGGVHVVLGRLAEELEALPPSPGEIQGRIKEIEGERLAIASQLDEDRRARRAAEAAQEAQTDTVRQARLTAARERALLEVRSGIREREAVAAEPRRTVRLPSPSQEDRLSIVRFLLAGAVVVFLVKFLAGCAGTTAAAAPPPAHVEILVDASDWNADFAKVAPEPLATAVLDALEPLPAASSLRVGILGKDTTPQHYPPLFAPASWVAGGDPVQERRDYRSAIRSTLADLRPPEAVGSSILHGLWQSGLSLQAYPGTRRLLLVASDGENVDTNHDWQKRPGAPREEIGRLMAEGLLPRLDGIDVVFCGLGATPDPAHHRALTELWTTVLDAGRARSSALLPDCSAPAIHAAIERH